LNSSLDSIACSTLEASDAFSRECRMPFGVPICSKDCAQVERQDAGAQQLIGCNLAVGCEEFGALVGV
jgi:hypothetical protein